MTVTMSLWEEDRLGKIPASKHRQEGPFLLPPGRLAVDLGALRGGFATEASEWLLKQTELSTPVAEPMVVLIFFFS